MSRVATWIITRRVAIMLARLNSGKPENLHLPWRDRLAGHKKTHRQAYGRPSINYPEKPIRSRVSDSSWSRCTTIHPWKRCTTTSRTDRPLDIAGECSCPPQSPSGATAPPSLAGSTTVNLAITVEGQQGRWASSARSLIYSFRVGRPSRYRRPLARASRLRRSHREPLF